MATDPMTQLSLNDDLEKRALEASEKNFKHCFVPSCQNTTVTTPNKTFITVPVNTPRRQQWMKAVYLQPTTKGNDSSRYYCCSDHFDLENDASNYVKYSLGYGHLRMKEHVVPHISIGEKIITKPQRKRSVSKKRKVTKKVVKDEEYINGEDRRSGLHKKRKIGEKKKDNCNSKKLIKNDLKNSNRTTTSSKYAHNRVQRRSIQKNSKDESSGNASICSDVTYNVEESNLDESSLSKLNCTPDHDSCIKANNNLVKFEESKIFDYSRNEDGVKLGSTKNDYNEWKETIYETDMNQNEASMKSSQQTTNGKFRTPIKLELVGSETESVDEQIHIEVSPSAINGNFEMDSHPRNCSIEYFDNAIGCHAMPQESLQNFQTCPCAFDEDEHFFISLAKRIKNAPPEVKDDIKLSCMQLVLNKLRNS